ncbi:MAG TPA: hypothetical protein VIN06_14655 [Devosia sp.]
MRHRQPAIEAFFEDYARRSNDALQNPPREDIDGIVASFAAYFVGSNPRGVFGGANGPELREVIPQGFARYREVGGKAMRITNLSVTELDDVNVMATVDWAFDYVRPGDGKTGTITFTNRYFLSLAGGAPKIFAYITPDEEQAMQDHGLVPA